MMMLVMMNDVGYNDGDDDDADSNNIYGKKSYYAYRITSIMLCFFTLNH